MKNIISHYWTLFQQKKKLFRISISITGYLLSFLIFFIDIYFWQNEVTFSTIYLLPIIFVTWYSGIKEGIILALVCIAQWSISYISSSVVKISVFDYLLNMIPKFAVFLFIVMILSKLKSKEKKLKESNQDLEQFAFVVSHDLKSPLGAVIQLTDYIKTFHGKEIKGELEELITVIEEKNHYMIKLIESILSYSKINAENIQIKEEINLELLIQEVLVSLSIPSHIHIVTNGPFPVIESIKIYYIQLLQNLLSNAVKYIDKPEGLIQIGCTLFENYFILSVSDNGPGISKRDQSKIFELFKRLENSHNKGGTGVGLAVVRKIVEKLDGKIWLESIPNQSTTFFVRLPLQKDNN